MRRGFVAIGGVFAALARPLLGQVPGEIHGRISDATSGHPIGGARIELVGRAAVVFSQVDGSFVMRGLDPGEITVRFRALGHAPTDTTVVAVNGRSVTVDVALQLAVSRLDPIVVQSRRDSASAVAFDRRAIEQSGRRDVGELLRTVPSVVVTQAGGPGSPSHISIRGSSASEVLVLVDGNPINSPITGEADLSRIGIESVERVTVVPGAQSARYGGRALAGVVVIETRRSISELSAATTVGAWGEHDASASVGRRGQLASFDGATSIGVDYRETRGDFSYDVPLERGGGRTRRANGDARSLAILASTSLDGDDANVHLRVEGESRSRGLPGSIVQPSTSGRQHDARLAGGVDGRWTFGRVSSTANVDIANERETFVDPNPPFGSIYDDTIDATSAILTAASTATFSRATLSLGGESRTLDVSSSMLAPDAPHVQRQWGAWATTRAFQTVANDIELSGDVSARFDWDSLLDRTVASPRVGVTASRGPSSLSAFFGAGYAPPSLADQFFHEGVLVRPNPSLRPERVRKEVEVHATIRDVRVSAIDFGADAAVYHANIDGLILWQPDFRFIWSPSNFDVTRSGWELSGRAGVASFGVEVSGSVSESDVQYGGPVLTGQVTYRPRTTANAGASLTHWGARLETTTRYIGERRTVLGSALNSLDAYWLTDVRLSRSFARRGWRLDASIAVENVFDRSASMLADYPFPGRTWTLALRTRR